MLKNLLIFSALFAVFPIQAACSPQKTQYGTSDQQPSPEAALIAKQQPASTTLQTESQKQPPQDVRIISTPSKDGWDRAAVGINGLLGLVGIAGIFYAARTLRAIKRQADTMDAQTQHMTKELAASQRPWISPNLMLTGPLKNSPNGPVVTVDIILENVGNTPAIGIDIRPVMYVMHISKPNPVAERKRICEQISKVTPEGWGHIVFPAKTLVQRYTFGTTPDDVEACKIGDRYSVELIICIAYRSTFDEAARHYTGAIYTLSRFEASHPNATFALKVGEELPIEGLRLSMNPFTPIVAK